MHKQIEDLSNTKKQSETQLIYSIPITPKVKGETPIYRKPTHKDGLVEIPSEIKNLNDFWNLCLKRYESNLLI